MEADSHLQHSQDRLYMESAEYTALHSAAEYYAAFSEAKLPATSVKPSHVDPDKLREIVDYLSSLTA